MKSEMRKQHSLIKTELDTVRWEKGNKATWIFSIVIGGLLASVISFDENTVVYFLEYTDILISILLSLLAIQVGAYALLHALLDEKVIVILFDTIDGETNMLRKVNREFIGSILLYFHATLFSVIIRLFVIPIPNDFLVFPTVLYSNILAWLLISIFLGVNIRVLLESKNFYINLYKLIRIYCAEVIKEKKQ